MSGLHQSLSFPFAREIKYDSDIASSASCATEGEQDSKEELSKAPEKSPSITCNILARSPSPSHFYQLVLAFHELQSFFCHFAGATFLHTHQSSQHFLFIAPNNSEMLLPSRNTGDQDLVCFLSAENLEQLLVFLLSRLPRNTYYVNVCLIWRQNFFLQFSGAYFQGFAVLQILQHYFCNRLVDSCPFRIDCVVKLFSHFFLIPPVSPSASHNCRFPDHPPQFTTA